MAECGCGWFKQARNGMGLAAQHFNRCGQMIFVTMERTYIFEHTRQEPQPEGERSGGIVPSTEGEFHTANLDGGDD